MNIAQHIGTRIKAARSSAIPIDGINKDGYVQLLITLRAVRP